MKQKRSLRQFRIVLLAALFFCSLQARTVFAAEQFDPYKLAELERLQSELAEEKKQPAEPEAVADKKPSSKPLQPSQQGIQLVSEEQLTRPPEVIREEFQVISRKKTLLERLSLSLHSNLNYDSNVFRQRDPQSDFFYRSGGSLEIDASNLYKELGFVMTYGGDWTQYFSFSRLNSYNQNINFDVPGYGKRLRIGKKITVGASVGASLGQGSGSSEDQGIFPKSFNPYARVNADYLISKKFSTDFTYNFALRTTSAQSETAQGTVDTNSNGKKVTTQDHDFSHRLKYHLTPKTFTFLGVGYGFTTDNGGSNAFGSSYQRITAGIEGKLTAKSIISLESGVERRSFKSGDQGTNYSLYLKGAYLVQLTRKWSARAVVIRDTQASTSETTGLFQTLAVNLGVTYKPTQRLILSTDPYFRYNQVDNQSSGSATPSGSTAGTTPALEAEGDNNYTYGIDNSIRYYVRRWLSLNLAYRFERRRAQSADSEYVDHLATFGVNIGPISKWKG